MGSITEYEAITELKRRAYRTTCYGNKVLEHEENLVAIEALEKQIPTRPYKKRSYEGIYYMCESCGAYIIADYCVIKPKYCNVCGQKLDWSD